MNGNALEVAVDRFKGIQDLMEVQLALLGVDTRDDRGAITIETAVMTAILAVVAVAFGAIIIVKMTSNAGSIPDTPALPGG